MAFYAKNIGSAQQVARIVLGGAAAVVALVTLSGPLAWATIAGGVIFAMTGLIGYCPMCAIAKRGNI